MSIVTSGFGRFSDKPISNSIAATQCDWEVLDVVEAFDQAMMDSITIHHNEPGSGQDPDWGTESV